MKREIKFRLWSDALKVMYSPNSEIGHLWSIKEAPNGNIKVDDGDVLMQFTGMHDCDGVEIYEGDIFGNENMPNRYVVFEDGKFCFNKVHSQGADVLSQDRIGRLRVIGNIYENPELLTQ